eukprot:TRINITY_DN2936_c0_g1_i1.p1 TRINITY_DN2936_c0_g1~~TRINITY_DN2936_c0_g1_i1.p1  ORF type:complete len:463 (+),score=91.61 TRINITY_DN2936_c0_g1_i1:114-1391(+)
MALAKALRDREPTIMHDESDESLFIDLRQVVEANPHIISKTIAYRSVPDRQEISRILGHLPSIREARKRRHAEGQRAQKAPVSARDPPSRPQSRAEGAGPDLQARPRSPAARPPVPRQAWDVGSQDVDLQIDLDIPLRSATPQMDGPMRGQDIPLRSATPQMDGPARGKAPQQQRPVCSAGAHRPAQEGRAATPRQMPPRSSTPGPGAAPQPQPTLQRQKQQQNLSVAGQQVKAKPAKAQGKCASGHEGELWYQTASKTAAGGARLGFAGMPLEDEVPKVDEKAMQELNQRQIEKLAEFGIDPAGMTATGILQLLYARGGGTAYSTMNKEAQKKLQIRAKTPLAIRSVLKSAPLREVKNARDVPSTAVHDCLDKWEIDTLAEVCRSMKHFDEEECGLTSAYTAHFAGRKYLGRINRKKYVRPPTP